MKLFYVIVGVAGSPFPVDIEPSETVGDLTKAIKKENKCRFKHVDAYDLQLYLAKKDKGNGAWLTEDDVATVRDDAVFQTYKLMKPTLFLNNTEICGESINQCDVHVLVKAPMRLPTIHQLHYRHFTVGSVDIRTKKSMTFDPPPLVRFWRALQGDRTEFKADAVLTLPEGTFLLGNPMLGSRIYIRHCYPRLWQVCLKMINDEAMNTPHLVILGNPGIGKTYFGYVILWLLARSGNTVVYESRVCHRRFLFSQDMVVQGSKKDFIEILEQTTTYYVVDGVEPRYYSAKTILLTSPQREVWYEFNKDDCRSCYMPVWSRDEVLTCRELMYSDIPESVVQDCFRRWGGIPRYVLHYATAGGRQQWLEKAMENITLDSLMDACGDLYENPSEESLHLLHYRVTKEFNTDYFDFASQYVLEEVYRRLYNHNKKKLLEFIDKSGWVGAAAVLRDHLFEVYTVAASLTDEDGDGVAVEQFKANKLL
eukprot:jgi/Phyca11/131973/e_gw1.125.9.1